MDTLFSRLDLYLCVLITSTMPYGLCHLPIVPLRAQPSHKSEMVSQVLFGESFEVIAIEKSWALVRLAYDQYEGWLDAQQYTEISLALFDALQAEAQVVTGLSSHSVCLKLGLEEMVNILPGSTLPFLDDTKFAIHEQDYLFLGESSIPELADFHSQLEETAQFYLNAPYLWGGRSLFGIDCSGYVQMVYKHLGIKVARDSSQQVKAGTRIELLDAKPGDLAFFDNEEGEISHVGILLEDNEIIHASGRVKVDRIDEQGIFCQDTQSYTHTLKIIKRIVD